MTTTTHEIIIGTATATDTGVDRGIDVDVTVDGHDGSVTLLPAEDGRGGYTSWGSLDHWVSPALVRYIHTIPDHGELLEELATRAGAEADAYEPAD